MEPKAGRAEAGGDRAALAPLADPSGALGFLADELRDEETLGASQVAEPRTDPALGLLAAAGPRCAAAPAEYAAVVESVREGYLLHFDEPRLLAALEPDLRLLIGDHLYARGIERLAALDDALAVRELADLISITAALDARPEPTGPAREAAWLAACVAIGAGPGERHEESKELLRLGGDARALWECALRAAEDAGLSSALAGAAEAVGFSASDLG